MSERSLNQLSATELIRLLRAGEASSIDIMRCVLGAIARTEGTVRAYVTMRSEAELLAEAAEADDRRTRAGTAGPLEGLPIAVKDNISTRGLRTTCSSRMLADYVPVFDATVVERVRSAGGIILGKTNMDEFAMGSSTENSAFQITRNPHNLDFVPGGTSGGSAAAVAADETILGLGSDTGGSIRQPASFCGVVGLKPSYGRVSRYGLISYVSSLDQIGPLAKSVSDAALLFSVIAGHDPLDATSAPDANRAPLGPSGPYTVGVPREYMGAGLDAEVKACVETAIAELRRRGHSVVDVSLPSTAYANATYYIVACAEASSNLGRFDGIRFGYRRSAFSDLREMISGTRSEGFGPEVKRRIVLGTYCLSAGYYEALYVQACRVRTLIRRDFDNAFRQCDFLMAPVSPTAAFRIGEKTSDPMTMYLADILSVPLNLAGLPGISVPFGRNMEGLPLSVQLMGPAFSEQLLLDGAMLMEQCALELGL